MKWRPLHRPRLALGGERLSVALPWSTLRGFVSPSLGVANTSFWKGRRQHFIVIVARRSEREFNLKLEDFGHVQMDGS